MKDYVREGKAFGSDICTDYKGECEKGFGVRY